MFFYERGTPVGHYLPGPVEIQGCLADEKRHLPPKDHHMWAFLVSEVRLYSLSPAIGGGTARSVCEDIVQDEFALGR